ncbi:MAG: tRNA (adenosine(37)-N6)-threonylcarbamoyltransferase complex ATPase subunit type 1 TsaE [Candidatus Paceibacterota bacterium]
MEILVTTSSPKETKLIASCFIKSILNGINSKRKKALVVSLEGNLGAGKTEFMKGIGEALKFKKEIFSPTFLIMKRFPIKKGDFKNLWHLDCYRIKNLKEIKEIGFNDLLKDKENIIFIEWGDKIKKLLPKNYWKIKIKILDKEKRLLIFKMPLTL